MILFFHHWGHWPCGEVTILRLLLLAVCSILSTNIDITKIHSGSSKHLPQPGQTRLHRITNGCMLAGKSNIGRIAFHTQLDVETAKVGWVQFDMQLAKLLFSRLKYLIGQILLPGIVTQRHSDLLLPGGNSRLRNSVGCATLLR